MIKVIKITKGLLTKSPPDLLVILGLAEGNKAFPERLYMSRADCKALRTALRRSIKKSFPATTAKYRQYVEGMAWLSYGPNESLDNAIKPGYALIDLKTIKIEGDPGNE